MSEPTQDTAKEEKKEEKPKPIYDAAAKHRFEFELKEGGLIYDIAQIFGPLDNDERYIQWLEDFKIKGNQDDIAEESTESSCRYWDDVIDAVEGIDFPEGADWKSLIEPSEKTDGLKKVLAVAIADLEEKAKTNLSRTGDKETQTIVTECWANDGADVAQQRHVMRKKTKELQKKYARIEGKRFKQENTRGLRRKPRVEYIPQDAKFGELYDEMKISATGFANEVIPLRFKTTVVHEIFTSELDPKK